MKLPRWLVIAMLSSSVLSVPLAAGWWWVTWPERTAREFVERLAGNDDESWKTMMRADERSKLLERVLAITARPKDWSNVTPQPRTLIDLCAGRHGFLIDGEYQWNFIAERGMVVAQDIDRSKVTLLLITKKRSDEEVLRMRKARDQELEDLRQRVESLKQRGKNE